MTKKHDLPAMPFYVGDWMKCPEVRSLSFEERGMWFDMLCLMWESKERGYLTNPAGKPFTTTDLSRILGNNENLVIQILSVLKDKMVYSVREEDNAIYCRRMVNDEKNMKIWLENAKKGGNPKLKKSGYPKRQPKMNPNTEDENEDESEVKNEVKVIQRSTYFHFKDMLFSKTYDDFINMRKSINKKVTFRAEELILKKLHNYDVDTAIKMIEQSIMNSYQGIFELKKKAGEYGTSKGSIIEDSSKYQGIGTEIQM
jgi:hypothetical protein